MSRDFLAISAHTAGTYRVETLGGTQYIVVPVVALVEGVIQGITSNAPELALATEFGKFPTAWNGRPITIDHPHVVVQENGHDELIRVSANTSPEVMEDFQVGFIFNTQLKGNKLVMEAWIDPVKANQHSDEARQLLATIKKGGVVEVSTGLFASFEQSEGVYEGKAYFSVWRGVVPDHLALLPEGLTGACSVEAGCGANVTAYERSPAVAQQPSGQSAPGGVPSAPESERPHYAVKVHRLRTNTCSCGCGTTSTGSDVNATLLSTQPSPNSSESNAAVLSQAEGSMPADPEDPKAKGKGKGKRPRKKREQPYKPPPPDAGAYEAFDPVRYLANAAVPDGMLDNDVRNLLQKAISDVYAGGYPYVIGFTNNTVVFSVYEADGERCEYEVDYSIDAASKAVTLGEEYTKVVLTTTVTPAPDQEGVTPLTNSGQTQETTMTTAPQPGSPAPTSQAAPGTGTPAETTNTPAPAQPTVTTNSGQPQPVQEPAQTAPAPVQTPPTPTPQPPVQTVDQYLAAAPVEIRASLEQGMRMHAAYKQRMIDTLVSTNRCKFTKEQLTAMDVTMLENMVELSRAPDYSGQGAQPGGLQNNARPQANEGDSAFAPPPPRLALNNNRSGTPPAGSQAA